MTSDLPSTGSVAFRSSDSLPLSDVPIDALDLNKVAQHIAQAVERGRYTGPVDPLTYLHQRHCVAEDHDTLCATPAGVLCFGYRPQDVFSRAVTDLAHYRGAMPISFEVLHLEKDIGGTLFEQIDRVEAYLWANTHHGMTVADSSIQRVELHEYPRVVIRELTVNMLAHRDYTNIMSAARVQLFQNTIEWVTPGGLPPGMTIQNLLIGQAARNPAILSILYEAGYVEAIGQGLDTVVAVLAREEMAPPRFENDQSFFRVVVSGRLLEMFTRANVYAQLSERQRRILTFIRDQGTASSREIVGQLVEKATQRSVQRDLKILLQANLIEAVGDSVAARYRLPNLDVNL